MRIWAATLVGAALFVLPVYAQEIASARYLGRTDVYGHGAVKDGEYARLNVVLSDGRTLSLSYENAVFEDTEPRLHDFDKDGAPEIVTVVSSFDAGARVQILGLRDGQLVQLTSNMPIGTRNRWLAIAGIADFNNDGLDDIAYVDRPHLAKVLRILSVELNGLTGETSELAAKEGLTNHHYKAPIIEGGVRNCDGQVPVIVTADANWNNIVETQMVNNELQSKAVAPYAGLKSFQSYMACNAG